MPNQTAERLIWNLPPKTGGMTAWTPGQWGKATVGPGGINTWNVPDQFGTPDHGDVDPDHEHGASIQPDGETWVYTTDPASAHQVGAALSNVHPEINVQPQLDALRGQGWHMDFKVPTASVESAWTWDPEPHDPREVSVLSPEESGMPERGHQTEVKQCAHCGRIVRMIMHMCPICGHDEDAWSPPVMAHTHTADDWQPEGWDLPEHRPEAPKPAWQQWHDQYGKGHTQEDAEYEPDPEWSAHLNFATPGDRFMLNHQVEDYDPVTYEPKGYIPHPWKQPEPVIYKKPDQNYGGTHYVMNQQGDTLWAHKNDLTPMSDPDEWKLSAEQPWEWGDWTEPTAMEKLREQRSGPHAALECHNCHTKGGMIFDPMNEWARCNNCGARTPVSGDMPVEQKFDVLNQQHFYEDPETGEPMSPGQSFVPGNPDVAWPGLNNLGPRRQGRTADWRNMWRQFTQPEFKPQAENMQGLSTTCYFHPDRPAVAHEGFAAMCQDCLERYRASQAAVGQPPRQGAVTEVPAEARMKNFVGTGVRPMLWTDDHLWLGPEGSEHYDLSKALGHSTSAYGDGAEHNPGGPLPPKGAGYVDTTNREYNAYSDPLPDHHLQALQAYLGTPLNRYQGFNVPTVDNAIDRILE